MSTLSICACGTKGWLQCYSKRDPGGPERCTPLMCQRKGASLTAGPPLSGEPDLVRIADVDACLTGSRARPAAGGTVLRLPRPLATERCKTKRTRSLAAADGGGERQMATLAHKRGGQSAGRGAESRKPMRRLVRHWLRDQRSSSTCADDGAQDQTDDVQISGLSTTGTIAASPSPWSQSRGGQQRRWVTLSFRTHTVITPSCPSASQRSGCQDLLLAAEQASSSAHEQTGRHAFCHTHHTHPPAEARHVDLPRHLVPSCLRACAITMSSRWCWVPSPSPSPAASTTRALAVFACAERGGSACAVGAQLEAARFPYRFRAASNGYPGAIRPISISPRPAPLAPTTSHHSSRACSYRAVAAVALQAAAIQKAEQTLGGHAKRNREQAVSMAGDHITLRASLRKILPARVLIGPRPTPSPSCSQRLQGSRSDEARCNIVRSHGHSPPLCGVVGAPASSRSSLPQSPKLRHVKLAALLTPQLLQETAAGCTLGYYSGHLEMLPLGKQCPVSRPDLLIERGPSFPPTK
ncbi:hypothetical protein K458DRAFT_402482 [Lentithecium fluviatile CBS 122367]|uniref:Uncharacterized protein n=1 Tax=Lentithecium fluviatile CBS 122367 TaxID=1168545 RepID=A0A6G1J9R5_9PLEO|nr:hypothetical protein K458DRAFT_402482 [Lentithecium fluviatile CBS 122367]